MRYNNLFKMQDFFMNPKLDGVFPQVSKNDMQKDIFSDEFIHSKIESYLSKALGGSQGGGGILIANKSKDEVIATVNALKPIIEGFFDNAPSIFNNIKSNTKLYTTLASLSQLQELKSEKDKLKFFNEIQDNINYNPDFSSPNSVKSYSPLPYQKRQQMWQKKVNYK